MAALITGGANVLEIQIIFVLPEPWRSPTGANMFPVRMW